MFRPVSSKVNFPQIEETILKFWKERDVFNQSVKLRQASLKRFTLYDGPPTANGKPGIHHVLSRVYKDIIPRYKTMKGFYAPRKAGWDTHGLPVELEIEKKLGLSSKTDIENYGIEKFNELCRASVFTYVKEWNDLTERIGFWIDLSNPYVTLDNEYIESVWWALKQLSDKDLIYQGYRVTPHCPRCGTSLSSHEIALGYKDDTVDPSIYIKFEVVDRGQIFNIFKIADNSDTAKKPVYFLAWTTTPWTLPGNTALAISANDEYCIVEDEDECLILAKALLEAVGLEGYSLIGYVQGINLESQTYIPLYNPHDFGIDRLQFNKPGGVASCVGPEMTLQKPLKHLAYKVITADFISMEEGTGIVHIAPAFGEIDFEIGRNKGLDFVQPVDLEGKITGSFSFSRKFVKQADKFIAADLEDRGLLYKLTRITHTYPFCWRCDSPVLYYAKKTWYIRTTAKKQQLIDGNEKINWYPEHIKYGRFGDWLQNNVDWAFSRERYWGTPLNAWHCNKCGKHEFIGSIKDLKSKPGIRGISEPLDLHRPYVDDITYSCPECKGEMRRFSEVIDCWFDSGAMPFAQWHHPFNHTKDFENSFPADYISEAVDQTRGWFYSLHAISTMLNDSPCYKNVICLGHILDTQGEKMSKTKGNVVEPWSVINKYGADALRWYFFISGPPGNVKRFSQDIVGEGQRNFLLTLWNIYSFFVTYANIDNINPQELNVSPQSNLDVWILSSLNKLINEVDALLDDYDPTTAARKIEKFIDDLSNWYIRRSRRRFWKGQNDEDKASAYFTLYKCITDAIKLLAPFTPFITDEIYRNLVCSIDVDAPQSVHLADFPLADHTVLDEDLIKATAAAMAVCSLGRAARAKAGIKVRQPLSRVLIKSKSASAREGIQNLADQIVDELNVKQIVILEDVDNSPNLISMEEGDFWVAVDTHITTELESEGVAREIVRRLQVMRRSAGLDISDHIIVNYQCNQRIKDVMCEYKDYISDETLASDIVFSKPDVSMYMEKHKLLSSEVVFALGKYSTA